MGLVAWTNGDLETAHRTFSAGLVHFEMDGNVSDTIAGAIILADIRCVQGRLHQAMRTYEQGLRLATMALQAALAQVLAALDLATLALQQESFIDEELRQSFTDMLYAVTRRDGEPAQVYILFEHKSYPDRLTRFQLLRGVVQVGGKTTLQRMEKTTDTAPAWGRRRACRFGERGWTDGELSTS